MSFVVEPFVPFVVIYFVATTSWASRLEAQPEAELELALFEAYRAGVLIRIHRNRRDRITRKVDGDVGRDVRHLFGVEEILHFRDHFAPNAVIAVGPSPAILRRRFRQGTVSARATVPENC